ncbi:hypothetical protein Golob_016006 [Gossypium lobatum]|uniref:Acireductone dioxygenase n=1 Tax=Gossypium lobatum TaxID=34289 RepID=A0A7J8M308_9ROSI|nr:hypothetical protein [Gossypium lobatum]
MDESKEDQRLPHRRNPNEPVSLEHLAELGVLYWHLNPKDYENDEELKKIREARGYNYMRKPVPVVLLLGGKGDSNLVLMYKEPMFSGIFIFAKSPYVRITLEETADANQTIELFCFANSIDLLDLCPEKVANYEEKLRNFYTEHIHADEEIRYCLEGSGYFDVRDKDDRWIRIWIKGGDLIILPAGIYHRFTLDTSNYVKLMRLFLGEPVWTAYNRPQEDHPARKEYIKSLTEKVGMPLAAH